MMILVVCSSLTPDDSPLMKKVDHEMGDKALHFCAYFVLSLLAVLAQQTRRKSVIAAVLMGVLGLVLEVLQSGMATRSPDVADAAANWIGVASGTLLGLALV